MPRHLKPWELPSMLDGVVAVSAIVNGVLTVAVAFVAAVLIVHGLVP